MKYELLADGVVKRKERRVIGLFIDGTGLDRATRRLNKKVDLELLVKGVTSGAPPAVARYYTLIPYEDDSRQRAFLDAVHRAGLSVVVKRLPPKGVARPVSVDVEMAADIVAFALGHSKFSNISEYSPASPSLPSGSALPSAMPFQNTSFQKAQNEPSPNQNKEEEKDEKESPIIQLNPNEKRVVTVVCPSRDLSYPISLVKELGVDTSTADFGQFNSGDILKSAAKWIDLSDSETIWRS